MRKWGAVPRGDRRRAYKNWVIARRNERLKRCSFDEVGEARHCAALLFYPTGINFTPAAFVEKSEVPIGAEGVSCPELSSADSHFAQRS